MKRSSRIIGLLIALVFVSCVACSIIGRFAPEQSATPKEEAEAPAAVETLAEVESLAEVATSKPEPTATLKPTTAPTNTPAPTPTPTEAAPKSPFVTSDNNINIRNGPSTDYEVIGSLTAGEELEIIGRNSDSTWWQVSTFTGEGWVAASVTTATNVPDDLPVVEAPPLAATPVQVEEQPVETVPTATPPPAAPSEGRLVIVTVNKDAEYVDIQNTGGGAVDLSGWHLLSEKGFQDCVLGGVIQPGETLRIWAMGGPGGYSCGFGKNIWNNSERDPAVLIDPNGGEVSRK